MQHILSVGTDAVLLHTRVLVLEKCGAAVTGATPDQALLLLESRSYDLLVLCHSVPDNDVETLCRIARRNHGTLKTLLIDTPAVGRHYPMEIDYRFPHEDGPHQLIKIVQHVLGDAESRPHPALTPVRHARRIRLPILQRDRGRV